MVTWLTFPPFWLQWLVMVGSTHYNGVWYMSFMAHKITSNLAVSSTACSGWHQRKQHRWALLALCEGKPHDQWVPWQSASNVESVSMPWHQHVDKSGTDCIVHQTEMHTLWFVTIIQTWLSEFKSCIFLVYGVSFSVPSSSLEQSHVSPLPVKQPWRIWVKSTSPKSHHNTSSIHNSDDVL